MVVLSIVMLIVISALLTIVCYQSQGPLIDTGNISSFSQTTDAVSMDPSLIYGLSIYAAASSLAVLVLVVLTFYLYRWRKILLSKPESLVPEKWAEVLLHLKNVVETTNHQSIKNIKDINSLQIKNFEKTEQTLEAFMSLHKVMDEKDKEIRRLKKGYDKQIYSKFLKRFIRADVAAKEMMQESPENTELQVVTRLVEDALLECDVEFYEPQIGKDYRNTVGVADSPFIIETQDTELDFQIAEVIEPGYHILGAEEPIVLREAKVKIYRIKKVTT